MSESPIPRMIEEASQHIAELIVKINECQPYVDSQAALQDELERVEKFIVELKGGSEITRESLTENVLEVLKKTRAQEFSSIEVAKMAERDRRGVSKVMKELETRGVIIRTREEKVKGRYPRKYYTLSDEGVEHA